MQNEEIRGLERACEWALNENAPPEAKTLLREIQRRATAYTGQEGWLYETPPQNRAHQCVDLNLANVPVAWIDYDPKYGFFLETTNVYGDGSTTDITFCPFCGEKLTPPPGNNN